MFNDEIETSLNTLDSKKITIFGQSAVFVEDIKKIISISTDEIAIRLKDKALVFVCGTNLFVAKLEPGVCQISGKIQSVQFGERNDKK